jgi:hypothetical protein
LRYYPCKGNALKRKERAKRLAPGEATMGFEPMMRVLQTLALPLGHVAILFLKLRIAD